MEWNGNRDAESLFFVELFDSDSGVKNLGLRLLAKTWTPGTPTLTPHP